MVKVSYFQYSYSHDKTVPLPIYVYNGYPHTWEKTVFTRGQFWPSGIVVACVRRSVRQSVRHQVCPRDNSSPVQAKITKFGPEM